MEMDRTELLLIGKVDQGLSVLRIPETHTLIVGHGNQLPAWMKGHTTKAGPIELTAFVVRHLPELHHVSTDIAGQQLIVRAKLQTRTPAALVQVAPMQLIISNAPALIG
jgi:hypothetical protein